MHNFIKNYIDKITKEDIVKFAGSNNLTLTENEVDILYSYLKNNWEDLLYGNPSPIIKEIEDKFGSTKSKTITELFYLYKEKYKNYL